jgi:hypothetical protein
MHFEVEEDFDSVISAHAELNIRDDETKYDSFARSRDAVSQTFYRDLFDSVDDHSE